jgi:hypothetical protein
MKNWLIASVLILTVLIGAPAIFAQSQGSQDQQGGWYCPGMGQGRMMHQQGGGCQMMGPGRANAAIKGEPVTLEQARKLLDNYLVRLANPNLKAGELVDKGGNFEATIVTKDGSLVQRIEIDKNTGWFRNIS